MKGEEINKADLACSFQTSVIKVLVSKTIKAAKEYGVKQVVVAGGVAANKGLRLALASAVEAELPNVELSFPSMKYCTDNAAMIAVAGYFKYLIDKKNN